MIARLCVLVLLASTVVSATAATYAAPTSGNDLIGQIQTIRTQASDTLSALAIKNDLGLTQIKLANPQVDPWLPGEDTRLILPTRYVLPQAPRNGIVINLAEMRVYYYPPADSAHAGHVITYPVGIGRKGWGTPLGDTHIVRKKAHPNWYPPASIRKEHAAKGDPLPAVVLAGPDNPLGQFALYLALPGYLMHGTNKPAGIGLRVSHGCIRLYPKDIAKLFKMVGSGTPVHIINQPYKVGWNNGMLYLEAHPVDATGHGRVSNYSPLTSSIIDATHNRLDYTIDWNKAARVARRARGIPVAIGAKTTDKITLSTTAIHKHEPEK